MGMLQTTTIVLPLLGDGSSTVFTIAPANIPFAGVPGLNPIVPLAGAYLHNESISSYSGGITGVSTVDVYGNLTITFSAPIPAGVTFFPSIDLYVASGAVVATTATFTNATAINTVVEILLGVAIPTLNVAYNPTGSAFGGAEVMFETSIDGGTTWLPIFGTISTAGGIPSSSLILTGTPSIVQFNVAGFTNFRVRLSTPIVGAGTAEFGLLGSKQATNVTLAGGWVTGTLTNNLTPPSSTNFGALTAIANVLPLTYAENAQVLLSTDLHGSLRVTTNIIPTTVTFAISTGAVPIVISTGVPTPLLSIQPNSASAAVVFLLTQLRILGMGSAALWQLVLNGTLAGANFVSVDPSSGMTYDTAAVSIAGGRVVDSGYLNFGAEETSELLPFSFTAEGSPPAAVGDIYTLVITQMGARPNSVSASFRWTEEA